MTEVNASECSVKAFQNLFNSTSELFLDCMPYAMYLKRALIPLWVAIGVPGAVLSLLVWSSKRMRSSSSIYLCALAVLDGAFLLLIQIPYHMYQQYQVNVFRPGTCHALPAINMWLQYLSPVLTLGFTIERYISICHPFRRDELCTVRRALMVTGGMTVCCLGLSLVQVHFYQYSQEYGCSEDPLIFNSSTMQNRFYNFWTKTTEVLFFVLVPLAILLFNMLVLLQARRVMEKQVGGHQPKSKSSATTATLLTVSFYQIGAVLPVSILLFLGFSMQSGDEQGAGQCSLTEQQLRLQVSAGRQPKIRAYLLYITTNAIVEGLSVSHYAMKFIIYLLTGSMFRRQLLAVCGSCLRCLGGGGGGGGGGGDLQLPVHRTSEERRRWRRRQSVADDAAADIGEEASSRFALMGPSDSPGATNGLGTTGLI